MIPFFRWLRPLADTVLGHSLLVKCRNTTVPCATLGSCGEAEYDSRKCPLSIVVGNSTYAKTLGTVRTKLGGSAAPKLSLASNRDH